MRHCCIAIRNRSAPFINLFRIAAWVGRRDASGQPRVWSAAAPSPKRPERDPLIVRELNTTILVQPDFSIARDRLRAWFMLPA
jgi:hypothetical protein